MRVHDDVEWLTLRDLTRELGLTEAGVVARLHAVEPRGMVRLGERDYLVPAAALAALRDAS